MATTTVATLIQRTRRFVRDWPEFDALTASATSTATSLTVADATIYTTNWIIQVDSEAMRVRSGSAGTTLNVRRGVYGTTGASHANSATVLVKPEYLDQDILDALNAAVQAAFPLIYRRVAVEYTGVTGSDYEYAIPDMPGITGYKIPYVSEVWLRDATGEAFRRQHAFRIVRDETTPLIQFRRTQVAGATLRIVGFGPYPALVATDSLPAQFPPNAEDLLVWYAGQYLLASGEAGRVRVDTGVIDDREQANRVGSSMTAANSLFQRFQIRLRDAGMPPMPRHVVPTI